MTFIFIYCSAFAASRFTVDKNTTVPSLSLICASNQVKVALCLRGVKIEINYLFYLYTYEAF